MSETLLRYLPWELVREIFDRAVGGVWMMETFQEFNHPRLTLRYSVEDQIFQDPLATHPPLSMKSVCKYFRHPLPHISENISGLAHQKLFYTCKDFEEAINHFRDLNRDLVWFEDSKRFRSDWIFRGPSIINHNKKRFHLLRANKTRRETIMEVFIVSEKGKLYPLPVAMFEKYQNYCRYLHHLNQQNIISIQTKLQEIEKFNNQLRAQILIRKAALSRLKILHEELDLLEKEKQGIIYFIRESRKRPPSRYLPFQIKLSDFSTLLNGLPTYGPKSILGWTLQVRPPDADTLFSFSISLSYRSPYVDESISFMAYVRPFKRYVENINQGWIVIEDYHSKSGGIASKSQGIALKSQRVHSRSQADFDIKEVLNDLEFYFGKKPFRLYRRLNYHSEVFSASSRSNSEEVFYVLAFIDKKTTHHNFKYYPIPFRVVRLVQESFYYLQSIIKEIEDRVERHIIAERSNLHRSFDSYLEQKDTYEQRIGVVKHEIETLQKQDHKEHIRALKSQLRGLKVFSTISLGTDNLSPCT
jgi:hypothetical protein